ncbi:glycosyltransferase [Microbacterium saperdae]|uniref:Beta-1,4-mannosyltransferase n=1 Tax=Microbacterium saperdae TaxID=69368 RepID=A0A543BQP3_9MICO|nr:glycosyltransferase [Microbacterium saperdae]TQL87137.1 beta-1,4-mannosyltransferase [Microbacterium saperdae]GGM42602.1 GDP-mannose:glycolipid 4-beta-D-mannosyltransferase [Microbacterium saperdae]
MTTDAPDHKLHALVSYNRPRNADNHFVNLFTGAVSSDDVQIHYFTPRYVIAGRIDVFSLHWPELLAKGSSPVKQLVKYALLSILIVRIVVARIPVLYTVHNEAPHEATRSRWQRFFYRRITRLVTFRAYLNEAETNDYTHGCVVLHGAYPVKPSTSRPLRSPVPNVLCFGNVRPYKGLELVIGAAKIADPSTVSFRIVGAGNDENYLQQLRRQGADVQGLSLEFGYLDDDDLLACIAQSSAAILPYRHMYNSGVALLALSAGRPILVPDSPANAALASEIGTSWVRILPTSASDEEWAREASAAAAHDIASSGAVPDLSRRQWDDIGGLYRQLLVRIRDLSRSHSRREVPARMRSFVEASPDFVQHSQRNAADSDTEAGANRVSS